MAAPLIQLTDIALTFGRAPLLAGVELSVSAGERICLVGRNGSGKSTLLKIAAGLVEPDRGSRFVQPGVTMRYLPQEPDFGDAATVGAYVEQGLGPTDDPFEARRLLEELGLTGEEQPGNLSGGEARRAAIARTLAPAPDILLLDEPTNHLDLAVIEWLERELAARRSALVLISHDRRFLANLSRSTVWLDRGTTRRIDRGFSAFEAWRDEVFAEEEREQHKLDRKLVAEADWLRYGVTARRKRNVRRLEALYALRQARREHRGPAGAVAMTVAEATRSGTLAIEAEGIGKAYDGKTIVQDFSIRVARGDRIGIVGPNGSGKTTLINMLTGVLAPDGGSAKLAANLEFARLEQQRSTLDPETRLADALTGGSSDTVMVGGQPKHVIGYLQDFLFTPEQARTPLRALSGGERGRLLLARIFARPSNILVLDEPTNDLDLETLDVLQDRLGDYAGVVLLVSHDRDFLDRVVNAVIAPEGKGKWVEYAGGYTDMLAQRGEGFVAPSAARTPVAKAAAQTSPKAQARPSKRRLSFNDTHALATLPKRIADLERQIETLRRRLDDPALYAQNPDAFAATAEAMTAAQSELTDAEGRWLELEILREEIEQA
ncbi:ATP-binding cassette, subfamily F, uup [Rhizobiales bacterium GAS191]|nr:ATP-binding cassette, subfamily F, uup [Rhizobiales bacterium GAS191]